VWIPSTGTYTGDLIHEMSSGIFYQYEQKFENITDKINRGDLTEKPGWIRMSIHPTQTDEEINFILDSIEAVVLNKEEWSKDYEYHPKTNEFVHKYFRPNEMEDPIIHCLESAYL
jgi:hypothetical protein